MFTCLSPVFFKCILQLGGGGGCVKKQTNHLVCFVLIQKPARTSRLEAPIMLLTGHEGEIFCCKFSVDGSFLASAGHERLICEY